jgi:hypothetical protein
MLNEDQLSKLVSEICNRTKIPTKKLDELDEHLRSKYGVWDAINYFPIEQIVKHSKKKEIINEFLRLKLEYV